MYFLFVSKSKWRFDSDYSRNVIISSYNEFDLIFGVLSVRLKSKWRFVSSCNVIIYSYNEFESLFSVLSVSFQSQNGVSTQIIVVHVEISSFSELIFGVISVRLKSKWRFVSDCSRTC